MFNAPLNLVNICCNNSLGALSYLNKLDPANVIAPSGAALDLALLRTSTTRLNSWPMKTTSNMWTCHPSSPPTKSLTRTTAFPSSQISIRCSRTI